MLAAWPPYTQWEGEIRKFHHALYAYKPCRVPWSISPLIFMANVRLGLLKFKI
jgi:hypothetical protein